jgi:hypothetical protein
MLIFEQPRGDVTAFSITYDFQCNARQFQTRDAVFMTTANTQDSENGVVNAWGAVTTGSVSDLLQNAACHNQFGADAHQVMTSPAAEAPALFRRVASTATPPARRGETPPPSPSGPIICRGVMYIDGAAARSINAWVTIESDVITVRYAADDINFTQRYRYTRTPEGDYRMALPNGWMTYSANRRSLISRYSIVSEVDDADPNNPYPVEIRRRVEDRLICTAG